jgi:glycosyltransferase involved in cell wall biosynthesis
MARGHRTRLVTSHRGWPSRVDEDGLEVVRQFRPPERPFNRLGFPAGTSHALPAWWALRRGDDDVVQGWTAPAALAAAHSGKPSVFVFQGVLNENDLTGRPRVRSMLLRAARGCDVVTSYSEGAAHEFTRLTGIKARAIEPGIRLDAFTPADPGDAAGAADPGGVARAADPGRGAGSADRGGAAGVRHHAPAIFCAADPDEPRKRVRLLVDAFATVRRSRPDAELWVMPTADPAVRGASGVRIVDPGADRDALVRIYREASVSVLPAFREAFGLVVVESLACGTPVVGMRDGGAVPQILGRDGFVAEPTPDSLARTLLDALDATPDPAACRRIAERYSIERCAQQYEALYEELLAA